MISKTGVFFTAFTLRVMSIVVVSVAFCAIAQAQDLDEVRELDMALQKQVRGVIGAFNLA